MIDTIKFRVPIDRNDYNAIKAKSHESVRKDNWLMGFEDWRRLDGAVTVKPFNAKVGVFAFDETSVYLECSLPKIVYGHNVKMFYPSQLLGAVELIEKTLRAYYGDFPSYRLWLVQRLDMCYAYKFSSHLEALRILDFLSVLRYPRKSIHIYPKESVNWGGRSYNMKFYLKELEFYKKGMKEMILNGFEREADEALALSKGVLRFEITFRKAKLIDLFKEEIDNNMNPLYPGKNIYIKDILKEDLYINTLNQYLETLLGGIDKRSMSFEVAMELLKKTFGKDKPLRLFNFYTNHYSQNAYIRKIIRNNYNSSNIRRNLESLCEAGVGIPNDDNSVPFDLTIPNINAVNTDSVLLPAKRGEEFKQ
ncbi:MAG: hypothetical protein NTZ55_01710 [Candidatus Roizmanbacteria bacterium]|nr:hypothetical protein [Candidatus Roizmanbacteria bacterium]